MNTLAANLTPDVEQARVALGDAYTQQLAQQTFVNHLFTIPGLNTTFSTDYAQRLTAMQQTLNDNISIITDSDTGAPACYQTPAQCVDIYNSIMSRIKPIDQQLYTRMSQMYFVNEYGSQGYSPDYYIIQNSDTSYAKFHVENMAWAAYQSITPTADGGFDINGIDGLNATFSGHMTKQPDGTYSGMCIYSDGRHDPQVYTPTPNYL